MPAAVGAFNLFSSPYRRRSKSLVSIARTKVSTTPAILPASPGVMSPPAIAEVTAFIAAAMSAALSIGGSANSTGRSRHRGRMRSIQPQCHRVAGLSRLDGLPGQSLGLAGEQRHRGEGRPVARTGSPPGRVVRPAFSNPRPRDSRVSICESSSTISVSRSCRRRVRHAATGRNMQHEFVISVMA